MILTLDVGNSTMTGGIFDGDKLILQFRQTTNKNSTSDEIGIFLRSILRENNVDPKSIEASCCCSVVPPINYSLSSAIKKYFNIEPLFIQSGIKTGLKLKYANPKEIGADRIAAAIGAVRNQPNKNLIVIDMGTATTIDVVTKDKEYLGGAILPGLKISVQALASGTAKLPTVEIVRPNRICGQSTIEAIQSGIFYGNAGAIKEFCYQYQKQIFKDEKPVVIGTGGFARTFENYGLFDVIVPELVLLGVKSALEMNREVK
ncbi:MAG: type III pantothenate kinase [Treponema sp.]|nr:type III pantothenate kinase [Treponema sp.]MBR4629177.1 type III pantothenate kinase [Treponema sp.]MBR6914561.1 type III pantothenate kinase [Treponema sp.]MCR5125777.1 type III pantothenate kinase [Treponema sp.]